VRFPWKTVLGFALSAALLYWVFRGVNWLDVGLTLRESDVTLWILAVITSQLIFPLRALRWRPILHSIAPDVRFGSLWRATTIGMMVNNVVIPSRLGELARAYALAREEPRVPFAAGLASLVVPIPRTGGGSIEIGDVSLGVETQHSEKISPILSAVMILGGAGLMIAGKARAS